jgi:peptidoglycan-associated lipoprotein
MQVLWRKRRDKVKYQLSLVTIAAFTMIGVGCANKKVALTTPPTAKPAEQTPMPEANPAPQQSTPTPQGASKPTPLMPSAATKVRIDELLAKIDDAYFDYNRHTLRPDAIQALQADATDLRDILTNYSDYKLTIEGHCDERGSEEF